MLHYHHVDVFTATPFGGNQLAVYPDGRGLTTAQMQTIAREMNFSETTFLLPPEDDQSDYRLRIFTPSTELPIAGHPTVGTAFVLRHLGLFSGDTVRFQENVGIIPVTYDEQDGRILAEMSQPIPQFGPTFDDRPALAEMLSIGPHDLHPSYPAQALFGGQWFLYIPIAGLDAMHRLKLRLDVWEREVRDREGWSAIKLYMFAPETEDPTAVAHARMFAPSIGIAEDPATGAACGPLGAYLVEYGWAQAGQRFMVEQGIEMGRSSQIYITSERDDLGYTAARVAGYSVYMGAATLEAK